MLKSMSKITFIKSFIKIAKLNTKDVSNMNFIVITKFKYK